MLIVPTNLFDYDKNTKTFSIDASSLETLARSKRLDYDMGQWYIHLRSHVTGVVVKFVREQEIRDNEGELVAVNFNGTCGHSDLNLQIIND